MHAFIVHTPVPVRTLQPSSRSDRGSGYIARLIAKCTSDGFTLACPPGWPQLLNVAPAPDGEAFCRLRGDALRGIVAFRREALTLQVLDRFQNRRCASALPAKERFKAEPASFTCDMLPFRIPDAELHCHSCTTRSLTVQGDLCVSRVPRESSVGLLPNATHAVLGDILTGRASWQGGWGRPCGSRAHRPRRLADHGCGG